MSENELDEYIKQKDNELCEDFEFLKTITKRMIEQELQEINEQVKNWG